MTQGDASIMSARIGVNHIALVCKDMAATVDFYTRIVGLPLVKTLDLGPGHGQHFFFDCGEGECVAFFWFPNGPAAAPGVASQSPDFAHNGLKSAHGSLNYLSLNVAEEEFDDVVAELRGKGLEVREVTTAAGSSAQGGHLKSAYFFDPDGIRVEIATALRPSTGSGEVIPRNVRGERVAVERRAHVAVNPIVYGAD